MILTFITAVAWILVVLYALALLIGAVMNRVSIFRFTMHNWIAFSGPLSIVWLLVRAYS